MTKNGYRSHRFGADGLFGKADIEEVKTRDVLRRTLGSPEGGLRVCNRALGLTSVT